jgi:hypothetical protein
MIFLQTQKKKNLQICFWWLGDDMGVNYLWTTELLFSGCGRAPSNQGQRGDEFVGGLAQGYGVLAPPHLPFHHKVTLCIRRSTGMRGTPSFFLSPECGQASYPHLQTSTKFQAA